MRRCLGCMREYDEAFELCPECGYVAGSPAESTLHLAPGTVLCGRYLLGKVLGQGGFGITYIAWDEKLDRPVAVKEYMPGAFASRTQGETGVTCFNEEARRQFLAGLDKMRRETRTLAKFNELESVVRVYDCIEDNGTAYIIMELLRGCTAKQFLKENGVLSFEQTVQIILPVLQTLQQIHRTGLIHRDISPDNIFLCSNGKIKLLDFGSARIVSGTDQKGLSVILKPGYAPKEQYSVRGAQGSWTDLYSVAATMYKMLTGETPVDSLSRSEEDDPLVPIGEVADIPDDAAEAIMDALAIEPQDRTQTADDLLCVLSRYAQSSAQTRVSGVRRRKASAASLKKWLALPVAALLVAGCVFAFRHYDLSDKLRASLHKTPAVVQTQEQPIQIVKPDVSETLRTEQYLAIREKLTADTDDAVFSAFGEADAPEVAYTRAFAEGADTLTEQYDAEGTLLGSILRIEQGRGRKPDEIRFSPDGSVESAELYAYDADGAQKSRARYSGEKLEDCDIFVYDGSTLTSVQSFDGNLNCTQTETYERKTGLTDRAVRRDKDGAATGFTDYKYDKGVLTEATDYDAGGTPLRMEKYTAGRTRQIVLYENGRKAEDRTFEYDTSGHLKQEKLYDNSDTLTQKTEFTYDDANRLTQITHSNRDHALSSLAFAYDEESGALTAVSSYDYAQSESEPIREQHPDGSYTQYEYEQGVLKYVSIIDAEGNPIGAEKIDVNAKGLPERKEIVTIVDEEEKPAGYSTYSYDDSGCVESKYTESDKLVERIYSDPNNILYRKELYNGEDEKRKEIRYDEDGQETGSMVWKYNDAGKITSIEQHEITDGEDKTVQKETYDYYADGTQKEYAVYAGEKVLIERKRFNEKGKLSSSLEASRNGETITGYTEILYDIAERETTKIVYDKNMQKKEEYIKGLTGNWRLKRF